MGGNFFICFVCFDFCSYLRLYIIYPINKQNHPEKGDFVYLKNFREVGSSVARLLGVIGAE